jgi:hypothetical protein
MTQSFFRALSGWIGTRSLAGLRPKNDMARPWFEMLSLAYRHTDAIRKDRIRASTGATAQGEGVHHEEIQKYNEKVWPLVLAKVGPKPEPRRAKRRGLRAERRAASQRQA